MQLDDKAKQDEIKAHRKVQECGFFERAPRLVAAEEEGQQQGAGRDALLAGLRLVARQPRAERAARVALPSRRRHAAVEEEEGREAVD